MAYLKDLKKRADDLGVTTNLIMCDGEGRLGDPDNNKRTQAVKITINGSWHRSFSGGIAFE